MDKNYQELIHSARVSEQTRAVLLQRNEADSADSMPKILSEEELTTLRSVVGRVIPQLDAPRGETIDIAARIDGMLAEGNGDGWRYADLPGDVEAYRTGLRLLNELAENANRVSFDRLGPEAQDTLLWGIVSGRIRATDLELQRWFEDLRANATQIYVSHPETLARMGYSGIADDPKGFVQLGGKVEAWEPTER